jgi:uncharacterized membrane protein YuzA (DUF378 family)
MNNGMNTLFKVVVVLAVIGALNWGLVGFFEWNLVDAIFTRDGRVDATMGERVIYALVGLAGLMTLFALPRLRAIDRPLTTRSV